MEVGEGAVDADIEAEVGRLGVVVVKFAVAVAVEHDGAARLLVPRDHRVVAHHHTKVLFQEGGDGGAETHLLDLVDLTEVVLVGADGAVVIALDEELVAGELFQQVTGVLALEEREVAKDVDGVALVDSAPPKVEQPLVVGRDVHRVGKRALGRVLEDVGMTEMEVGSEIDLVCHIQNLFCLIIILTKVCIPPSRSIVGDDLWWAISIPLFIFWVSFVIVVNGDTAERVSNDLFKTIQCYRSTIFIHNSPQSSIQLRQQIIKTCLYVPLIQVVMYTEEESPTSTVVTYMKRLGHLFKNLF